MTDLSLGILSDPEIRIRTIRSLSPRGCIVAHLDHLISLFYILLLKLQIDPVPYYELRNCPNSQVSVSLPTNFLPSSYVNSLILEACFDTTERPQELVTTLPDTVQNVLAFVNSLAFTVDSEGLRTNPFYTLATHGMVSSTIISHMILYHYLSVKYPGMPIKNVQSFIRSGVMGYMYTELSSPAFIMQIYLLYRRFLTNLDIEPLSSEVTITPVDVDIAGLEGIRLGVTMM